MTIPNRKAITSIDQLAREVHDGNMQIFAHKGSLYCEMIKVSIDLQMFNHNNNDFILNP